MNIIPTPQYVCYKAAEGSERPCDTVRLVYIDEKLKLSAAKALDFLDAISYTDSEKADLIITTDTSIAEKYFMPDYLWFNNKNASAQGYIIKGLSDGKIVIFAEHNCGIMYALSTFVQIPSVENEFEIKDYPDFRYRGNKWLLWAETEIWSYDLGDGVEALKRRVVQKLDICLRYKINMVFFDAWGFDTERFEGYAELMKFFNTEARMRGIYLIFGGYSMGYGLSAHQFGKHFSNVYKNRTSYPDGDIYDCLGTFIWIKDQNNGEPYTLGREFGTCLSNERLMDLKLEEIRNYITKTCPGGLYLHNMDSFLIDERFWESRCDECRKKWPNDDLLAPDGMAGAFAYFFDRLNGGMKDICIDDYNSSEDMLIFNVSPGYMWYFIEDYQVKKASDFWKAVRKYSKVKSNVFPTFRELFFNLDNNKQRIPDIISDGWDENYGFAVINFNGSDGFYSDKIFFAGSLLNYMFKGADVIISCNGNYFQEPMQLFNAEYMWNCENSAFYNLIEQPEDYESFMKLFFEIQRTEFRPEKIYGKGGMLNIICDKLYGENGTAAFEMFKLCGTNYECPVPYVCNKELSMGGNDVLLNFRWDNELDDNEITSFISSFAEYERITAKAIKLLEGKPCDNEYLCSYHKMLSLSLPFISLWREYLELYSEISGSFSNKTTIAQQVTENLDLFVTKCESLRKNFEDNHFKTVDLMKGAFSRYEELTDVLKYNAELMTKSIRTNKRIPDDRKILTKEQWW